ncbi:MAG: hypothetical protein QXT45_05810 [Candidatus Bilamarchaeaceae archaeon]
MADMVNREKKDVKVTTWSAIRSKCMPAVDFVVDMLLLFILTVLAAAVLLSIIVLANLLAALVVELINQYI